MVDVLGYVSVMSDAPDLRMVLELLLQLLVVVDACTLSGGKLKRKESVEKKKLKRERRVCERSG